MVFGHRVEVTIYLLLHSSFFTPPLRNLGKPFKGRLSITSGRRTLDPPFVAHVVQMSGKFIYYMTIAILLILLPRWYSTSLVTPPLPPTRARALASSHRVPEVPL